MKRKSIFLFAALALGANVAHAFDFGNMMNPGEWFDNDNDYYDRGYRGYGGGYGPYGYGPYGGGPYGWGGPYGGYGGPYGWGGPYGGYGGYPGAIVVKPSQGNTQPAPKPPE